MKKKILLLFVLILFVFSSPLFAKQGAYQYHPDGIETVTGIIQTMGRNSIEIYDDRNKRQERFIYFENGEQFHKGDHVRIYYRIRDGVVQNIKRTMVLEYKKDGQNLGNIFHK